MKKFLIVILVALSLGCVGSEDGVCIDEPTCGSLGSGWSYDCERNVLRCEVLDDVACIGGHLWTCTDLEGPATGDGTECSCS